MYRALYILFRFLNTEPHHESPRAAGPAGPVFVRK